jgi:hypothetical protein
MKLISAKVHHYLDYVVVAGFLAAPSLFYIKGLPAIIAYVLAAAHLTLTLFTDFPSGAKKVIPLKIHGIVEVVVGPCVMILPFVLFFTEQTPAATFYEYSGILIFVVWLFTDYKNAKANKK